MLRPMPDTVDSRKYGMIPYENVYLNLGEESPPDLLAIEHVCLCFRGTYAADCRLCFRCGCAALLDALDGQGSSPRSDPDLYDVPKRPRTEILHETELVGRDALPDTQA